MARVQAGYDPGAEALQTTAAPDLKTIQAQFDPRGNSAFRLAEALGKAQPVIDKFNEDYERKKIQEQMLKLDAYKSQFSNAQDGVKATQVGEKFPETNPIVRARVAEGVGVDHGNRLIDGVIAEINGNDNIRLDSAKRNEFIQQKRAELISQLPGDDFFKAGAIKAIDAKIDSYDRTWMTQTAAYHQEVQKKTFGEEVTSAFMQNDPKQALLDLDAKWGASSSLNNVERNKLVVDQATKLAFVADDPSLLDKIPDRFLNNDTKAEIVQMKNRIQEKRISNFRNAQYIQAQQREEETRNAKLEIIDKFVAGQPLDDARYARNPEAYDFALKMKDAGRIPDAVSTANAQEIRRTVLSASTVAGMDQKKAVDQILANPSINPKEKQELIKEMPKLIEGTIAMQDPMVKSALDTRVEARLKALESSTNARIQTLVSGRNLRGEVMKSFDMGLRQEFQTYYEETKNWPTGRVKQEIIDRQTDRAEKLLETLTSVNALKGGQQGAPAASPAAPAAPAQSRPGVKRYNPATGKIE